MAAELVGTACACACRFIYYQICSCTLLYPLFGALVLPVKLEWMQLQWSLAVSNKAVVHHIVGGPPTHAANLAHHSHCWLGWGQFNLRRTVFSSSPTRLHSRPFTNYKFISPILLRIAIFLHLIYSWYDRYKYSWYILDNILFWAVNHPACCWIKLWIWVGWAWVALAPQQCTIGTLTSVEDDNFQT